MADRAGISGLCVKTSDCSQRLYSPFAEGNEMTATGLPRLPFVLLILLIAGAAQVCWAHAVLMDSTPKPNSTVTGSDLNINLRFSSRIDGGRSRVRLVAPDRTTTTLTLAKQSAPDTLQAHAGGLKPGAYKLEWQVLASDGHITSGDIPFTIN